VEADRKELMALEGFPTLIRPKRGAQVIDKR